MNELKKNQKKTKKRWNMGYLICCFFGHKYKLKNLITPYIREIKCNRCRQEFGMNDHTKSVLPLDDELIELHTALLNDIKNPTPPQNDIIGSIVVLSHKLNDVEIVKFDFVSGYGWTFSWYENQREKAINCMTYGLFPQDFLQINGGNQNKIEKFLKNKPKDKCIEVSEVLRFLNIN